MRAGVVFVCLAAAGCHAVLGLDDYGFDGDSSAGAGAAGGGTATTGSGGGTSTSPTASSTGGDGGQGGSGGGPAPLVPPQPMPDSPTPYCSDGSTQLPNCPDQGIGVGQDCCFLDPLPVLVPMPDMAPIVLVDELTGYWWRLDVDTGTAFQANMECLNSGAAGRTDWRVPSAYELTTLLDFGHVGEFPYLPDPFEVSGEIWTSTADSMGVQLVLGEGGFPCDSGSGLIGCAGDQTLNVICVAGDPVPRGFLTGGGGETVIDDRSLLEWSVDLQAMGMQVGWNAALTACNDLILGGNDDWRLPSIKELVTLARADEDPGGSGLTDLSNVYWSSTPPRGNNMPFAVMLPLGKFNRALTQVSSYRVRCVRGPVTALPMP